MVMMFFIKQVKFEYKYLRWIFVFFKKYLSFNVKNNGIMERFCIFVKKKMFNFVFYYIIIY